MASSYSHTYRLSFFSPANQIIFFLHNTCARIGGTKVNRMDGNGWVGFRCGCVSLTRMLPLLNSHFSLANSDKQDFCEQHLSRNSVDLMEMEMAAQRAETEEEKLHQQQPRRTSCSGSATRRESDRLR